MLLDSGAHVDMEDGRGRTALHYSALAGQFAVIVYLITEVSYGATHGPWISCGHSLYLGTLLLWPWVRFVLPYPRSARAPKGRPGIVCAITL